MLHEPSQCLSSYQLDLKPYIDVYWLNHLLILTVYMSMLPNTSL